MFTYHYCPKAGAKRSDVPYGHASMLLFGEGNEATRLYNKYTNHFVPFLFVVIVFQTFR